MKPPSTGPQLLSNHSKMRRWIVGSFGVLLILAWLVIDHSKRIKPMKVHTLGSLVNIHASAGQALRVDGKVYQSVKGYFPYYLVITNRDSIFFVTEQANGRETFHVYSLREKEDLMFPDLHWGVGSHIHSP